MKKGFPYKNWRFIDFDRDGTPNWKDCKPLNPFLQHVRPSQTMKARLESLPIYFTTSRATEEGIERGRFKVYHISNKTMPKVAEKARQRFYSMIKKRPDVVGEIERKSPGTIVFTIRGGEAEGYTGEYAAGTGLVVVRLSTGARGIPYRRYDIEESAGTVIHELEHRRQEEAWKGKPKLQARMMKTVDRGEWEAREEEMAREVEERAQRKRYKYPQSEEHVYRGFRRIMED